MHDVWLEAERIGLRSRQGNPLAKQTLVGILQNRVYTGVFKYGSPEYHQGSYEPLISIELFNKVQEAMGWVRQRKTPHSTAGRYHPYKGLLMCGTCHFNVTAYDKDKLLASGTQVSYEYYTCTKKSRTVKCKEPPIAADELTEAIKISMSDYEISETDANTCYKFLDEHFESYIKTQNRYRDTWLRENRAARKALDVLDKKLEDGVISDERYKNRSQHHEAILARTTELLNTTDQDAERWLELAKELFSGVVNLGDVFEGAEDIERRELMKHLGLNWFLSNKKVALTPREPLQLLHVSNRNQSWRARPDSNRRSPP